MNPWFIWKNRTSQSMGLWVSKLPDIIRPAERTQQIIVPGRSGQLTLLEGEEVYDPYTRTITVQLPNENYNEDLLDWLQGEGDLIVCTEDQMVYRARIAAQVVFSRVGNCLLQGKIPFECHPLKRHKYPDSHIFTGSDGLIVRNLGNVASKPKLNITGTGSLYILFPDGTDTSNYMSFDHLPGDLEVDCEAGIMITTAKPYVGTNYYYVGDYCVYQGGASGQYEYGLYRFTTGDAVGSSLEWEWVSGFTGTDFKYAWPGKWYGDFLHIPTGASELMINGSATVTIDPRWRWK